MFTKKQIGTFKRKAIVRSVQAKTRFGFRPHEIAKGTWHRKNLAKHIRYERMSGKSNYNHKKS